MQRGARVPGHGTLLGRPVMHSVQFPCCRSALLQCLAPCLAVVAVLGPAKRVHAKEQHYNEVPRGWYGALS